MCLYSSPQSTNIIWGVVRSAKTLTDCDEEEEEEDEKVVGKVRATEGPKTSESNEAPFGDNFSTTHCRNEKYDFEFGEDDLRRSHEIN